MRVKPPVVSLVIATAILSACATPTPRFDAAALQRPEFIGTEAELTGWLVNMGNETDLYSVPVAHRTISAPSNQCVIVTFSDSYRPPTWNPFHRLVTIRGKLRVWYDKAKPDQMPWPENYCGQNVVLVASTIEPGK